ncbi:unnamed protein product [Paramecium sonneborni]|uniref:CSC1/OSCA1-like cytosolic domain-containing protein n=1 Tax=Paramecium sonneborni TaxID=65129 RepID=A0A8S1PVF7_9CILI|nr:unnamed protein product [Paramecium sonneborni]
MSYDFLMRTIMAGNNNRDEQMKFDADCIPPNFELASLHQKASAVGRDISQEEIANLQEARCPCCLQWTEKSALSIKVNPLKLSFLGTGVPLFFDFIKQCITILVIMFCTSGDYNLITNIAFGTSCQKDLDDSNTRDNCDLNYITQSSLANKRLDSSLMNLQQMLNLVSIFIIIILLQYIRIQQRTILRDCDFHTTTPSDFGVKLSHIPTENAGQIKERLINVLNEFLDKYVPYDPKVLKYIEQKMKIQMNRKNVQKKYVIPPRIHSITLCYDISKYQELNQEKEQHIKEKQKYLHKMYENYSPDDGLLQKVKGQYVDNELNDIENKVVEVNQKIQLYFDQFLDQNSEQKEFVGIAFVTFQWEADQEAFLNLNRTTGWGRYFGEQTKIYLDNQNIVVDEAPEPRDISWQNLHIGNNKKIFNRILSVILIGIQLCFTSWAIFNISKLQQDLLEKENLLLKKLASLASVIIIFINYLLSYSIKKIAAFQGFSTNTGHHISIATSAGIAQFVNSALVTWLVFTLLFDENYYKDGGLIYNQTYVFISNMIIPAVTAILDPAYWIKVYNRYSEEQKGKYSLCTQEQLNKLYENNEETLSDRYAAILKTMLMTSFYASIIPLGILFSIIALTLLYWVFKYQFLRRRTFKQSLGFNLSIEMTEILEYMIPIYCFSNFWFQYTFTKGKDVSSFAIIGVVIGIVNAVLPCYELNQALFIIEDYEQVTIPYKKIEKRLDSDYCRNNPATQDQAKQKFIQSMRVNK